SPRLAPDATMDALLGPIVYRALTGQSVPRGLVDTLVEDLLKPGTAERDADPPASTAPVTA
ncbi:MAG TPA: hypothetical protein VGL02_12000, partial [Streptomyces sp.]